MSSTVFEVVLRPDPRLRRYVFRTGIVLTLAGIILVACLQVAPLWRCLIGSIWLADCVRELRNLHMGQSQLCSLVLDSTGTIAATDRNGDHHELMLRTGSMILPGLAWLRVRYRSGKTHAELFTRTRMEPETWHRLQLLWNQGRDLFGHPPGP